MLRITTLKVGIKLLAIGGVIAGTGVVQADAPAVHSILRRPLEGLAQANTGSAPTTIVASAPVETPHNVPRPPAVNPATPPLATRSILRKPVAAEAPALPVAETLQPPEVTFAPAGQPAINPAPQVMTVPSSASPSPMFAPPQLPTVAQNQQNFAPPQVATPSRNATAPEVNFPSNDGKREVESAKSAPPSRRDEKAVQRQDEKPSRDDKGKSDNGVDPRAFGQPASAPPPRNEGFFQRMRGRRGG